MCGIPHFIMLCYYVHFLSNKDISANVSVRGQATLSTSSADLVQIMALDPLPKKQDGYETMLRRDCAAYISQVLPM